MRGTNSFASYKGSGQAFDVDIISTEPSKDPEVASSRRACRLTMRVAGAQNLKEDGSALLKHLKFTIKVEDKRKNSQRIKPKINEDGMILVNQCFTFDVRDPQNAFLSMHFYGKGILGIWETLGHIKTLEVSHLLQEHTGGDVCEEQWYKLYSKDGSMPFPGKVLMYIVAAIAEPEQHIRAFVGTWNVGNAQPSKDLSSWLPKDPSYEVVAIGAQECEYQPRQAYSDCGRDWMATLKNHLGSSYKVICGLSRGQMRLVVFVHCDVEKAISERDSGSEATGVGHVMANKGGLCICFKFWDTGLCFVNSHFAAHVGHCETRNSNYREILGQLHVGLQGIDILNQFHHVFWMGDLNYRLDFGDLEERPMTPERRFWHKIVRKIRDGNHTDLLQFDELHKEQKAGRVLYGFNEGNITFPPTFKMQRGMLDSFDQKRMPAWCDRVLLRSLPGGLADIISYTSSPSISSSDHKPVAAVFGLTVYALPSSFNVLDNGNKRWHIRFMSLQARNLRASDMNGSSDPYISFIGPNLFQEVNSTVRSQTLQPVWDPIKELPTVVLDTFPLQRLEKEYLRVRMMDYDYTSKDDVLGYGVIPLADAVAAFRKGPEEVAEFVVELSYHGVPAGSLEGTMKLTWESNTSKKRFKLASNLILSAVDLRNKLRNWMLSKRMF